MFKKYYKNIISTLVFIGIVGTFLGNLNNIPAFINNFLPSDISKPDIHGIWFSKYNYPISGGMVEITGTTEYFKNNSYNVIGEMGLKASVKGHSLYALYNVEATGIWQIDDESLTIRLEDINTLPKSVVLNGKLVDIERFQSILGKKFPRIEDSIPNGIIEEFKIVNYSANKVVLEGDAPDGSVLKITMTKQTKRFQRSSITKKSS